MIRCDRCDQWFVLIPTEPRTSILVLVDRAPVCQHVGMRLATADEIMAHTSDLPLRVIVDDRPLRTTPASDDPEGADVMLRWAHEIMQRLQERYGNLDEIYAWQGVFADRDTPPVEQHEEPRCGWG